jgi:hypothetical protein
LTSRSCDLVHSCRACCSTLGSAFPASSFNTFIVATIDIDVTMFSSPARSQGRPELAHDELSDVGGKLPRG